MEEPFKVGMSVIWQGGEEQGAFISAGEITQLLGKPRTGTLICMFKGVSHTFKKSDGNCIDAEGYIRLAG